MSRPIVRIDNLTKSFGSIVALNGICLEVSEGTIFGLLGPNGAGKTTMVKILTTLLRPDAGTVQLAGADVIQDPVSVRRMISYVPQELTVDPYLTAREHLDYYGDLYHLSKGERQSRTLEVLRLVGLNGQEDRRVRTFSGGMKKKLDLACGLIHRPPLLFLDEPSLGLDVHVRREIWNFVLRLKKEGTTVFLCTNYMDEAERLCDDVAIIDRGSIVVRGAPEQLRSGLCRDVIAVKVAAVNAQGERDLVALERAIERLGVVQEMRKDGSLLKIFVDNSETVLPQVLQSAAALKVDVEALSLSRPGLDEVFLHYTGRQFEEGREGVA